MIILSHSKNYTRNTGKYLIIINEKCREQLIIIIIIIIPVEAAIKQEQLRLLGQVDTMESDKLVKRIFEAREMQREKGDELG